MELKCGIRGPAHEVGARKVFNAAAPHYRAVGPGKHRNGYHWSNLQFSAIKVWSKHQKHQTETLHVHNVLPCHTPRLREGIYYNEV